MKTISIFKNFLLTLSTILLFSFCSSGGEDEGNGGKPEPPIPPTEKPDTIDYRAWIWVDKGDLERYGGERMFKNNLKTFFRHTTLFWNESENKFKYFFRFLPSDELKIYDTGGDPSRYDAFKDQAFGPMDTNKHDFVVFFALNANGTGLSCGGGGKSGQSVAMCYIKSDHNIFTQKYPDKGTYSDMGHEYGHVRGAIDMYQHIIEAKDNTITNVALTPDKCNMGNGMWAWSDYCSELFNYTANKKQLDSDMWMKIFPQKMNVTTLVNGKAERGVNVKFYGTRAGGSTHSRDVYPKPFREFTTNSSGAIVIDNVAKLYHADRSDPNVPLANGDDWPFGRWYGFVVVATDSEGATDWVWIPDYKVNEEFLRTGENVYEVVLNLKK